MAGIKFVLNERFLAYQQAVELAKDDKSVDLSSEAETESSAVKETMIPESTPLDETAVPRKTGIARKADELFKIKADRLAREKQSVAVSA